MDNSTQYDSIIIGGGLAGLSLAILLAKDNHRVLLMDKGNYPRHKVCGEYISMESWNFIERLGIPLRDMNLPKIDTLNITAKSGTQLKTTLDLGGFGISWNLFIWHLLYYNFLYKKEINNNLSYAYYRAKK